jgi:hypothetical protein
MNKKKMPWSLRGTDFSKPGWHTRPTIAYELMFEYLRLSPSYALANKQATVGLTEQEQSSLPADFNEVQKTYALLGDVQTILFRQWWIKRGITVFGNPYSHPKVHELAELQSDTDVRLSQISNNLTQFLNETRRDEGLVNSLLLSIPLGRRKAEVLKQVSKILDRYAEHSSETQQQPELKLMGKRLRAKVLFNGLRLLWFKAAKPDWSHWRLGAKARISDTYSKELDASTERKDYTENSKVDRILLGKITYRALRKFNRIAENAARGRFPCEDATEDVPIDYEQLALQIQAKNLWEKNERIRILKVHLKTKPTI